MGNQTNSPSYLIENDSFVEFFRDDPSKIHVGRHWIPLSPILSIHHHDAMELGLCLSGSGVFLIDNAQYPFSAPCASLIYPGELHKARSYGDEESNWVFLTFHLRDENMEDVFRARRNNGGVFFDEHLIKLVEETVYECDRQLPQFELCAHRLLETIVLRYERTVAKHSSPEMMSKQQIMQNLKPVLQYITEHFHESITVSTLSNLLFVHDTTLRKWFKAAFEMSPMEYVHYTRITTACSLLRYTGTPISTIAEEVGYPTISSFNRHFEAACGCSPRQYRRKSI